MFDFGFSELLVIALVALIVLGPERLPEVARTFGRWVGRAQRLVAKLREDLDRELKDQGGQGLGDLRREIEDTRDLIARSSARLTDAFSEETRLLDQSIRPPVESPPETAPPPSAVPPPETAPPPSAAAEAPAAAKRKPRARKRAAGAAPRTNRRKPTDKRDGADT